MSAAPKRATIYLPPEVHRALKLKAAAADRTVSDIVSEAVRLSLSEDAEDLSAFENRSRERRIKFESVVKALRRRGKLERPDQDVGGQGARGRRASHRPNSHRLPNSIPRRDATPKRQSEACWRCGALSHSSGCLSDRVFGGR